MFDNYFAKAYELTQAGVPFATATVVRAEAPTSARPGDRAIITADGVMHGWIGGSCAQPTVVREAIAALQHDESRLIRLSADPQQHKPRAGVVDLPMTCFSGGTLELFIEAHLPRPRLLIVGDLPLAQALAHLGNAMNYHVIAVDLDRSGAMDHADSVIHTIDAIGDELQADTYTVVATHGHYDEAALVAILQQRPHYVGLVASSKRLAAVRSYLTLHGFSEEDLLPLKAPAGLDIGARRGDEIALSIMAEIVQRRIEVDNLSARLLPPAAAAVVRPASISLDMQAPAFAIDPICNMQVDIRSAQYKETYDGQTYYFCCAGCQLQFAHAQRQG